MPVPFTRKFSLMRFAWTIFLSLFFNMLVAQMPAYLHYTVQDGLPSNLVYCGLQDRRGLLWFGTDKGLACFDGIRFRTYSMADGLPDPEVLFMREDSKGRLWLFCFRKKPCYMLNGKIVTEKDDPVLADMEFETGQSELSELPESGVWLTGSSERAYNISPDTIRAVDFPEQVVGFRKMGNTTFILGRMGIMYYTPDGKIESAYRTNSKAFGHPSYTVSGNRLLFVYQSLSILLEWTGSRLRVVDEVKQPTGQAYTDSKGRFWICSPMSGAVLFDNASGDLSNPVVYLPDKKVIRVFEDAEKNLWFCTVNEGLYVLPQNTAINYRDEAGFPSKNIRSIARADNGDILIGDDAGHFHILRNSKKLRSFSVGSDDGYNLIRQIIPMGAGAFYAATDEGLYLVDQNYTRIRSSDLPTSLKSMCQVGDSLWVGTATALMFHNLKTGVSGVHIHKRFTAVTADAKKYIWAGSIDGLYSSRDSFQINWGDRFPILKKRIVALKPNGAGKLWVVTPEHGLLSVDIRGGRVLAVDVVNKQQQLKTPINNIQSIYVEENGTVWMATNRGVFGLDKKGTLTHFSTFDGLADDDVNAVLVHHDTLWACTVSGLTCMPLKAGLESGQFQTLIVNLRYQQQNNPFEIHLLDSIIPQKMIRLEPDVSNLALDLTGLDFKCRGNLSFQIVQTKLLLPVCWWTFDNLISWVGSGFKGKSDTTREAGGTYNLGAFLPSGKYRFTVTAMRVSGVASQMPDTWTVLKLPYWYQVVWLQLLIWALVVYGLWRVYRGRMAYREIQATASGLQLQALQAQMNPHFIGNAINAIQQFLHPPNPEKTSEYIAIFMRLLRRTMDFSERSFITFDEELDYIEEYLQLTQLRFEDRFRYTITGAENIPPDMPIPSMLIQPVLENATLHGIAPAGPAVLQIAFKIEHDFFECTLTDNGLGFKETQRLKRLNNVERDSKGLAILQKKINTLNRLYDLGLEMEMQDLSETDHSRDTGTRVSLRFCLSKLWKVKQQLPQTTSAD